MTAVNSLIEALLPFIDKSKTSDIALHLMIEEHLAMEKEQLKDFYFGGCKEMYATEKGFDGYYNETFKSE